MAIEFDVLVDMQFGSTGKGALAGYLSEKNDYEIVVSANMPNAGHTAYAPNGGEKFIHKVLPSGIFGENLKYVAIGPGAVFDMGRLKMEWEAVRQYNPTVMLIIHEGATVLLPEHKETEQKTLSRISSTMQGSSEAMISKIRRNEGAIAKYHRNDLQAALDNSYVINQRYWLAMFNDKKVLVEGSQGYSLGINAGFYPYCTSRDCTAARVVSDVSLPMGGVNRVYGVARVHPIRVGNTPDGYSGDWYEDQAETSFTALGVESEKTTVTGRVRRIATFSKIQIREAMMMNMPDEIFLNFAQYEPAMTAFAVSSINSVAHELGCGGVKLLGFGPRPEDIKEA